jgi:hypothetical protein
MRKILIIRSVPIFPEPMMATLSLLVDVLFVIALSWCNAAHSGRSATQIQNAPPQSLSPDEKIVSGVSWQAHQCKAY